MQCPSSLRPPSLPQQCHLAVNLRDFSIVPIAIQRVAHRSHASRAKRVNTTSAAASSSSSSSPETSSALPPSPSPGDLLRVTLRNGQHLYLEVIKCRRGPNDNIIEALCQGEVLRFTPSLGTFDHVGHWPRLSDSWVKQHPSLQAALKRLRGQQETDRTLPSLLINTSAGGENQSHPHKGSSSIESIFESILSLDELEKKVGIDPSYWIDGTAPGDPDPSVEETSLLSAGELLSFCQGHKGVVLMQVELPRDVDELIKAPVPLLRPFVLRLLQRAITMKGVVVVPSSVPGVASSLVVASKQQPFTSWAKHLAGIGVQAALVADSPFYKLLIGRILGYRYENIVHHIESKGQRLDPHVVAAVDEELRGLSAAPPQLPWTLGRK